MRIVLDEALPRGLVEPLRSAGCLAEPFPCSWKGLKDGALLDRLEVEGGGLLLTCDRSMPYQQAIGVRRIAIVVLPGQRLALLTPLCGAIAEAALQASAGTILLIDKAGGISSAYP